MTDSQWFEIQPAYGRDYKSAKAANADWLAGLDFKDSTTGQYLSIRDFSGEGMNVIIRYNKLEKVTNAKRLPKGVELPVTEALVENAMDGVYPNHMEPDYMDASEMEITRAGGGELPASPIGDRPYIVHICNTAEYLLRNLSNTVEIYGDDDQLYSFEEFEGAVIQDSYELFPVHTIHCDNCDALRMVWMQHQFVRAMEGIHHAKRGLSMDSRAKLESLRLAIAYELEIARDMDGM